MKSDSKTPNVQLEEMGPSLDLNLRRSKLSSDDLYKKSKKQPKEILVSRETGPEFAHGKEDIK